MASNYDAGARTMGEGFPPQPPVRIEQTERQTIDALGEWLCRAMGEDILKTYKGYPPVTAPEQYTVVREVAKKIQWYRDNCLDS